MPRAKKRPGKLFVMPKREKRPHDLGNLLPLLSEHLQSLILLLEAVQDEAQRQS